MRPVSRVYIPTVGHNIAIGLLLLVCASSTTAQVTLSCSATYQISHSFSNGAKWDMCWELLDREGIVYSDVYYTTPSGIARRVFNSLALAQIHVPYDDDGARYHDVSDYGLGSSGHLNNLQQTDCPNGTRLQDNGKNVICRTIITGDQSALTGNTAVATEVLSVFSVSHVGAYNYIPEYRFFDTGQIEPVMGATGKLQRYGSDPAVGWPVRGGSSPVGISHLHNYYWRLDFDLGSNANDDVFEEIEFVADNASNNSFSKSVNSYSHEAARSINPATKRFWRVRDATETNAQGLAVSYDILALDTGHRDTGPSSEPFTYDDVYVTRQRDCERFISHNPSDPDGCASNDDVTDFVNGEALANQDIVVWFGITFHHIPRDEDEPRMHAHWNHFRLVPRDWTYASSRIANLPPVINNPGEQFNLPSSDTSLQVVASDPENQAITFTASGLPPGLGINSNNGLISGTHSSSFGSYNVNVSATDSEGGINAINFDWHVGEDTDQDGIANASDNCPALANANQQDSDADGEGNLCDASPYGGCTSLSSSDVPKTISSSGTPTVQSTLDVSENGYV
ncbi:MAG: hypothetical protein HKO60_04695, partial [Pseudomonadales bacterium]|nr:hypothetical protein [Pseudomonadales bacterium]